MLVTVLLGLIEGFPTSPNDASEEEKIPYSFSYTASRHYGGVPDREHKESRGPDGVTKGVFRLRKYNFIISN